MFRAIDRVNQTPLIDCPNRWTHVFPTRGGEDARVFRSPRSEGSVIQAVAPPLDFYDLPSAVLQRSDRLWAQTGNLFASRVASL